jgi:hypothetical protein
MVRKHPIDQRWTNPFRQFDAVMIRTANRDVQMSKVELTNVDPKGTSDVEDFLTTGARDSAGDAPGRWIHGLPALERFRRDHMFLPVRCPGSGPYEPGH